ncbi:hypothetical protein B0H10DRAFT_2018036 [Mycena sp. CBHHK59/15]|nr:hypothetical protein B0H10DRAFT_2018036 [Mycena sp. CBHHK59/15]
MTTTYSAWLVTQRGHPAQVLQLKGDLPIPTKLARGNVLVKVQAVASILGYKLMGAVPNFLARRPQVAEQDLAGVVVDPNGSEYSVGDKVFGSTTKHGVLAEYVEISSQSIVRVPPNISAVEAAGLGTVVATADQALALLKVQSGQTVFVNGGSSSVGLAAIQIAKSFGCKVVSSASGKNKGRLLNLGVDEFLDYTQAPLAEHLTSNPPSPKFHAIFDAVGLTDPSLYLKSAAYLAPGGLYVTSGPWPRTRKEFAGVLRQVFEGWLRPTWLGGVPRKYVFLLVKFERKDLETVRDSVAKGAVKPIVDSVHSFDRDGVLKAYERIMSKRAVGKVVVKITDE